MRNAAPQGKFVRVQLPLAASDFSQPDPDLAVVSGGIRDYEDDHPTTAALVVEVADTSLNFDRTVKAGLYASAEVPEYWIVNLNDRLLEVHRQPARLSAAPGGHHYLSIERYGENQVVSPILAPEAAIRVADLLPSRKDPSD